jgi:DNA/RNA endonuclease YhcR with UshA esterase domain
MGDETGTIRIVCWGDQADKMCEMKQGDIIKVKNGYVKENRGNKEVHLNDRALLQVNPPGETVGEVKNSFSNSGSYTRKSIAELEDNQSNVELLGTIVQTFEPKFFEVCPDCGGRARPQEDGFVCQKHGSVTPDYSYLMNIYLDDGSDNIRTVFFRDNVEKLVSKKKEEIIEYKDAPEKFEEVKTALLGTIVKVMGRTKRNEMFDRKEFIADNIDLKPDPEEEIKKLKTETPTPEKEVLKPEPEEEIKKPKTETPTPENEG